MSDDESPTYDNLKEKNVVDYSGVVNLKPKNVSDHISGPAPIDRALSDLHMNLGDAHQLLNELEAKIFPILSADLRSNSENPGEGSPESNDSRLYDTIRDEDATVLALQDRIRGLLERVQL